MNLLKTFQLIIIIFFDYELNQNNIQIILIIDFMNSKFAIFFLIFYKDCHSERTKSMLNPIPCRAMKAFTNPCI